MDIIIRSYIGNVKIPSTDVSDKDVVLSVDKRNKETWVERQWWKVFPREYFATAVGNAVPMCGASKLFTNIGDARFHAYLLEERLRGEVVDESLIPA